MTPKERPSDAVEEEKSGWRVLKLVLEHPIGSGLVVTAVISIATSICGEWGTVWKWTKLVLSSFREFLVYSVPAPVWLLGLMLLVVGACAVALVMAWLDHVRKSRQPEWLQYTGDMFEGMKWRWQFALDGQIHGLKPYCPKDDTRVISCGQPHNYIVVGSRGLNTFYRCETCSNTWCLSGAESEVLQRVERKIDRKIRTGEWRNETVE